MITLLLALATATAAPPLVFSGNVVLTDEVYLAYLDLPADFTVDAASAVLVRNRITAFLHRSGYELARVETAVDRGHIRVEIDEGRVEKLVVSGAGSLRTAQLLLALALPYNVFNRPYLERQLALVHAQTGVETEAVELVQLTSVDHEGPQLAQLGAMIDDIGHYLGRPLIPPQAPYEVRIRLRHREWSNGVGLSADLDGPGGLRAGVDYRGEDWLMPRDRWIGDARIGLKLRNRIADNSGYLALQDSSLMGGWYTPPIVGSLRPVLGATIETDSAQRPDLELESYRQLRLRLGAGLTYDLFRGAGVSFGAGGEYRSIFALDPVAGQTISPEVQSRAEVMAYASFVLDLVFDVDNIRRDRHHELLLLTRDYPHNGNAFGVTTLTYQRIFEQGWHDLWFNLRGAWVWGHPSFADEQQVGGTYVRGVFDTRFYTRRVVAVDSEVRFSITRDIYKVGAFTDLALFADPEGTLRTTQSRVVGAFGPSFHALIADAFQLDLYYAIGFATTRDIERGVTVGLSQAF